MPDSLLNIEKRILAAYKVFFGEDYVPAQNNNTDVHIKVHKMCYFLKRIDCDITDCGFVWNTFGPFSVALQEVLKAMDQKVETLQGFYQDYTPEKVLEEDVLKGINSLKSGLQLGEHNENLREWIELLGSLAFLAHSELPTSSFGYINQELKRRKSNFDVDEENEKAWNRLIQMGVAY